MACGDFAVPRVPGSCACCGIPLFASCPTCGALRTAEGSTLYRRLHFRLSNDSLAVVSVCAGCAEHEWGRTQLLKLSWQNPMEELFMARTAEPAQTWVEVQ